MKITIENPTDAECETLVKYNWIVDLCKIARLNFQADYMIVRTAKEAIYIHRGCNECKIYEPTDKKTFFETLK